MFIEGRVDVRFWPEADIRIAAPLAVHSSALRRCRALVLLHAPAKLAFALLPLLAEKTVD